MGEIVDRGEQMEYQAYRVHKDQNRIRGHLELLDKKILDEQLADGQVQVAVEWSGVNYKDALGPTGKGKIQRRFPLVVGIDLAGRVLHSRHPSFQAGDIVFANGCDLGEKIDGGFTQFANIPGNILMRLPVGLSPREAMILGTAGFTAALCRHRLEHNGQNPTLGKFLVTGATGGVGAFSVVLLREAGFTVVAMSGKAEAADWLRALGAHEVVSPDFLSAPNSALDSVLFGGAVENLGGECLSRLLPRIQLWGNIASVGLAAGDAFSSSVMPFILRGVSVLGISSNNCPQPLREELWSRLAGPWKIPNLDRFVHRTVTLHNLDSAFQELLDRKVRGRILVQCQN